MIIFNLGALIQAVVTFVIGFLCYQLGLWEFIKSLDLSMHNKNIITFYGIFFILAITYKLGAKGKVFFIPTWILLLLLIFIHNFGNDGEVKNWLNSTFTIINYILPIILFLGTFVWLSKDKKEEVSALEAPVSNSNESNYEQFSK